MPRVDYVRFTVQKADSDQTENYRSEEGTSYREVLEDDLCVNVDKFTLYVNGAQCEDLDAEVSEGDALKLQPKKYSSGLAA